MPTYMFQGSYTPAAVSQMIKQPEDRTAVVRGLAKALGGKVIGFWLTFGEHDFVGITELPDAQAAAAFSMAVASSGALHNCKTTELLSWEDGLSALKKAGELKYRPPTTAAK